MSQVRFQVLFGPASLHPQRMGWPLPSSPDDARVDAPGLDMPGLDVPGRDVPGVPRMTATMAPPVAPQEHGDWYGWRLIGANNRELGRSARSFVTYQLACRGVLALKQGVERLVQYSTTDPRTGRWGWRFELDGSAVAVSGRWYERDHDSRVGAQKFVSLTAGAELAEGVVTLHDRRASGALRLPVGGAR
jgi:hypothetical protein